MIANRPLESHHFDLRPASCSGLRARIDCGGLGNCDSSNPSIASIGDSAVGEICPQAGQQVLGERQKSFAFPPGEDRFVLKDPLFVIFLFRAVSLSECAQHFSKGVVGIALVQDTRKSLKAFLKYAVGQETFQVAFDFFGRRATSQADSVSYDSRGMVELVVIVRPDQHRNRGFQATVKHAGAAMNDCCIVAIHVGVVRDKIVLMEVFHNNGIGAGRSPLGIMEDTFRHRPSHRLKNRGNSILGPPKMRS